MARHLYIPTEPTPLIDRIRAHSIEVAVSSASLFSGLYLLVAARHLDSTNPNSALATQPVFLVYAIAAFVTLGGGIAIYGLLVRYENVRKELNIEQMGWLLTGLGWAAYALTAIFLTPQSVVGIILGVCLAVGSAFRFDALTRIERRTVEAVNNANPGGAQL